MLHVVGEHNHEQDDAAVGVAEILTGMRKRCTDSADPIPSIFDDTVDVGFKLLVRRAAILPLFPIQSIEDVWLHALEDGADQAAAVISFKEYVTSTWVEYNHQLWNHYDTDGPRTTTHVEGWHQKLNGKIKQAHPNIYTILTVIKWKQASNEVKMLQHVGGVGNVQGREFIGR